MDLIAFFHIFLDPIQGLGVGHWNFNDGTAINTGRGAPSLGDGTVAAYGKITYDPSRRSKIISCTGLCLENTPNPANAPCVTYENL